MWKLTVVAVCALTGCIGSNLVMCADGLACPVNARCDDTHHTCVSPDQLVVCSGVADGADCATGPVSGGCFDGVCLARGCGNRVVEPGEMCDDGNQISGDGCSADCRSTERCGNGFVDPGEACDDGDLISHDGCDSRCLVETAAWSVVAIAPVFIDAHTSAYDVARGRLVYVDAEGGTWEWNDARWTFAASQLSPRAVFYDPDRQQVVMIENGSSPALQLYGWTNGQWELIPSDGAPVLGELASGIAAAYDAGRHQVTAIATGQADTTTTWAIDAMGVWSELPPILGFVGAATAAYDAASAAVVVETDQPIEWVYNGDQWTSSDTSFTQTVSVAFDPDRGHLILVDNTTQVMYERIGSDWRSLDDASVPCVIGAASSPLYHEPGRGALTLYGSAGSQICRWNGAWTLSVPGGPFNPVAATYDPASRELVMLHAADPEDAASPIEVWTVGGDGGHRIETSGAPAGLGNPLVAYSSGRAAAVLVGTAALRPRAPDRLSSAVPAPNTWSFDGASWTAIASLAVPDDRTPSAIAYDPMHRRVVVVVGTERWALGDADADWTLLDDTPDTIIIGMAWDARNGQFMAHASIPGTTSTMFELGSLPWSPIEVLPGVFNQSRITISLLSDQRSGGVIVIESTLGTTWERIGGDWVRLPPVPRKKAESVWTAYNPADGSVLYLGASQYMRFAAVMTRSSATPLESCRPGEDLDGDGLAGCDDPECYWACSGCPPLTTCP